MVDQRLGPMDGISRTVLSDQVKRYLLDAIERGELQPGERLVESQLARQLRISQAPVREAIRDLVSLGFLEREPHKGAVVRSLTDKDMQEIHSLRAVLDALAAEQAAQKVTDQDLAELRSIMEKMIQAAQAGDYLAAARYDRRFHLQIVLLSGNTLLQRIYDNLQLGQYILITMQRTPISLEELAARHQAVIEALATRDPEIAKRAVIQHLEEVQGGTAEG
ncbi:MAG: GntR family transcriptional regulator [Anaerolineales bacterium]|nr:GntR family transcriptional regulator [Anaerolineales bacterium]MCS7247731.1 GntR family transcriptional regulator [Anaerolineales bacterium]MDW8161541.1 GntR family transcriptional regulator [Anaerolineales bacterium]MDW8445858.1 GntR family transcriptional regulator [Anaerolineales bacterium]